MSHERFKNILKLAHQDIDPHAIQIIKKLKDNGFDGYLVGGGVRDLLVGLKPKDFDIATNALPQVIKKKIPYAFIIGRRFKLVHAKRGDKIFEVATYRREATTEELQSSENADLNYIEENFFGTLEEDSFRRDFTINALFYDPLSETLVDHCNGLQDISLQTLRMIGDPLERIKEDPIRILRALRLSQKLKFKIETELRKTIHDNHTELQRSVLPRRREEWLKFFRLPDPDLALLELFDLQILQSVMPSLHQLFENQAQAEDFLSYIRRISHSGIFIHDPIELFAGILYSYLIAKYGLSFNATETAENLEFQNFCKDELGVYKAEFISIMLAIQFIQTLSRQDSYLKKGDRRRRSILNSPHFELALKLGLLSCEFSAQDFLFWINEKQTFHRHQNSKDENSQESNPLEDNLPEDN